MEVEQNECKSRTREGVSEILSPGHDMDTEIITLQLLGLSA